MMTRREFTLGLGVSIVATACGGSLPTAPESNPVPPTLNYLRTGVVDRETSLLNALYDQNPILSSMNSLYDDYFVRGFNGVEHNRLVFYIDNQRFEDRGVKHKILKPNQRWGVVQL